MRTANSERNSFAQPVAAIIISVLCTIVVCHNATAQVEPQTGQHSHTFEGTRLQLDYLLFLPEDYNGNLDTEWPLILYFHGAGANSGTVESIRSNGLSKKLEKEENFPFIVVSPHFPTAIGNPVLNMTYAVDRDEEVNLDDISATLETVIALVDHVALTHRVDKTRIYATGLSQGGYATWFIATAYPERFAAIAPVAGSGIVQRACEVKTMPVWILGFFAYPPKKYISEIIYFLLAVQNQFH